MVYWKIPNKKLEKKNLIGVCFGVLEKTIRRQHLLCLDYDPKRIIHDTLFL